MFDKITKKIINGAKETASKEINTAIGIKIPLILGIVTLITCGLSMADSNKKKITETSIVVINNYYIK